MSQATEKKIVKRIAAIDLGTNSFHAVIVDIFPDGSFYTVDKLKEMVLLAEKGFGDSLSGPAMERGIAALKKIKMLCDHQKAKKILAYATSAIREAKNGGEFIQRAIDEVGIKINAIPGKLEAELIGLAVQHGVQMGDETTLMMDIGGGSVEFIIGDQKEFFYVSSKKIGVARMTARFVDSDPISDIEITLLRDHFEGSLTDVVDAYSQNESKTLIGSSGTMENIAMMIAARNKKAPSLSVNELTFTAEQFFEFYDHTIDLSLEERRKLVGLDEKRVELINPGLVLVKYIIEKLGIKRVKISSQALREGIILRYIKRELSEIKDLPKVDDPRLRSVMELLYKYNWHEEHSRHVAELSLKIFDELKEKLKLSKTDRELLEYSAFMHDIGYFVSHRKHHKHALYIIRSSDLMGFKEYEIEMMANISRYHRRSTPKSRHPHYSNLPKKVKQRIRKLSGILRVADGLDRSHYQNVQNIEFVYSDDKLKMMIHTQADPELEIWGAMRKRSLLEDELDKEIVIESVGESVST